jgi:hypothetical protein
MAPRSAVRRTVWRAALTGRATLRAAPDQNGRLSGTKGHDVLDDQQNDPGIALLAIFAHPDDKL